MIMQLAQLLQNAGESLNFSVSRTGEQSVRVVLSLRVPEVKVGATKSYLEPFKTMLEGYEKARSMLIKPLLFEGSEQDVMSQIEAFVNGEQGEALIEGRNELSNYAEKIKALLEESEKKAKENASKAKSAGKKAKSSCASGSCSTKSKAGETGKADSKPAKSEKAKAAEQPKQETPEAPEVASLF